MRTAYHLSLIADHNDVAATRELQDGVRRIVFTIHGMPPHPIDGANGGELDAKHALHGRAVRLNRLACHHIRAVRKQGTMHGMHIEEAILPHVRTDIEVDGRSCAQVDALDRKRVDSRKSGGGRRRYR